jgi:hypothetical protein
MNQDLLLAEIESSLRPIGARPVEGEEYATPRLEVLRYFIRSVRLSRWPVVGRGVSVVAVVRHPDDVPAHGTGARKLLERVALAAHRRFPPWPRGESLSLAMTVIVVGTAPITADDDEALSGSLRLTARMRAVVLGLFRVNLDQGAMAFALARGPSGLFPEPEILADALTRRFRRFVPQWRE